jgi:hypothetical protein
MSGYCADGEAVAFHRETTRVSVRGTAKCSDCGRPVPKGSSYIVTAYVYDGSWGGQNTCMDCEALIAYLHAHGGECLYRGELKDWISELSPHDFRADGQYEDAPRASPVLGVIFRRWADSYGLNPETLEVL